MLPPPLTAPQVPKLSITTTTTISLPRLPSKTATTDEVQRWILADFVLRSVHPDQVPWVEDRVLWNGSDLRRCTLIGARKALEEWGCESAAAELIAWDIVEGVKMYDKVHVSWTTKMRKVLGVLALALGYFILFLVAFGGIGTIIEMIDGVVRDYQLCQEERERYLRPTGAYRTGYYGSGEI